MTKVDLLSVLDVCVLYKTLYVNRKVGLRYFNPNIHVIRNRESLLIQ